MKRAERSAGPRDPWYVQAAEIIILSVYELRGLWRDPSRNNGSAICLPSVTMVLTVHSRGVLCSQERTGRVGIRTARAVPSPRCPSSSAQVTPTLGLHLTFLRLPRAVEHVVRGQPRGHLAGIDDLNFSWKQKQVGSPDQHPSAQGVSQGSPSSAGPQPKSSLRQPAPAVHSRSPGHSRVVLL